MFSFCFLAAARYLQDRKNIQARKLVKLNDYMYDSSKEEVPKAFIIPITITKTSYISVKDIATTSSLPDIIMNAASGMQITKPKYFKELQIKTSTDSVALTNTMHTNSVITESSYYNTEWNTQYNTYLMSIESPTTFDEIKETTITAFVSVTAKKTSNLPILIQNLARQHCFQKTDLMALQTDCNSDFSFALNQNFNINTNLNSKELHLKRQLRAFQAKQMNALLEGQDPGEQLANFMEFQRTQLQELATFQQKQQQNPKWNELNTAAQAFLTEITFPVQEAALKAFQKTQFDAFLEFQASQVFLYQ